MTRNQIFAYGSSVIYVAAGVIGFALTGLDFTGHLLLVAEGAKDGVILVAGDVEVMKALPA